MTSQNIPAFLRNRQYSNGSNLSARIRLHQLYSTNHYGWFRWVFDHLPQATNLKVLEIGCGPGNLWKENNSRISDEWKVYLSDFSPGMIKEAQRNLGIYEKPIHFSVVDGQNIPFPIASFDVVLANHMLYHIPDRPKAIKEIRRVLKPAGIFLAATNGNDHMRKLIEIGAGLESKIENQMRDNFSARQFTLENGSAQLSIAFKNVDIELYDDELIVTEATPFVDYILSVVDPMDPIRDQDRIQKFQDLVEQIIQKEGAINVKKATGLLIAKGIP